MLTNQRFDRTSKDKSHSFANKTTRSSRGAGKARTAETTRHATCKPARDRLKDLTGMLRSCSAFSRALGRSAFSTRVSLRSLHTRVPQVPFSLSRWSQPTGDGLVPIVVEQTVRAFAYVPPHLSHTACSFLNATIFFARSTQGRGERSYDIFSRLLRERVIMLYGPVRPHASIYALPFPLG